MSRLATGGLIDRSRPLAFSFDGRSLKGFAGDTLASALLANDVRLVGRSFKYHRPRGILTAGSEEPNALVELRSGARREPNTRATMAELYDGLDATSQNRWPSLDFDVLSVNQWLSPFLGAGFYYKTFMWPASFWEKVYEPAIRRAAGLGSASGLPDPDSYEKAFAFCDLLVIGGGAAGLMAALTAGRSGARVILADEDFRLGGRLTSEMVSIDDAPARAFLAAAEAELASLPNVRILPRTTVFGVYDGGSYGAVERVSDHLAVPAPHMPRQRYWKIMAKRAVLCAGALDRPIVFGGNDRPGVMSAQALRTYAVRYAAAPGSSVVVFANNGYAWSAAFDAAAAGLKIAAIVDVRREPPAVQMERAKKRGVRVIAGGEVIATSGKVLSSVTVRSPKGTETIACDVLAMSGGSNPNVALTCHFGGRPVYRSDIAAFVPGSTPPGLTVAGAAAADFSLARASGERRGAGGGSGGRSWLHRPCHPRAPGRRPARDPLALLACEGQQGPRLRRLPERCQRQGRGHRPQGRLPGGGAVEALHHARHGHRPGQDLQRHRPRHHGGADRQAHFRDRDHHVPAALFPGGAGRAGGPPSRQGLPRRAAHPHPCLGAGTGRGVRGNGPVDAGAVFPQARREGLAGDRHPRGEGDPQFRRPH